MTPTVVLVSGSAPPDICGVGDYTASLAEALERAGQRVELLCHRDWSLPGTMTAIRKLKRYEDAIVHLQYPTMGYGYSLGPQLCALTKPCVVTLHEFTLAHSLRKLALIPFTLRTQRLVMTADAEKQALGRTYPWMARRIQVIPIGSNIPESPRARPEPKASIVNFGMIMPRKGLEDFIEFARLLRENKCEWQINVVGKIAPGQEAYATKLMNTSHVLAINWILDRSACEVSELLSEAGIGYFPFPDGASERRGSLRAACQAGLPSITTRSKLTPRDLEAAVVIANTPRQAAESAVRLMRSKEEMSLKSRIAREYAKQFSWESIARQHMLMYQSLTGS